MLRQNRSEGCSTSRSFAKTALLRVRRKTFQFSDEQFARHIFFTEPLFLIPSVQTDVQESGSTRGAILFRRNHFSSCRPAEPVRLEVAREVGFARDRGTLFEGTTFPRSFPLRSVAQKREQIGSPGIIARFLREPLSSFLPAETGAAGSNDIGLTGDRRCFFAGTTFPHSVGFTDAPLAAISLQQFFL